MLHGKEVTNVSITAKVISTTVTSTTTKYLVDDATGTIDVTVWINDDKPQVQVDDGMYCVFYGHVRDFKNQKSISAHKCVPIVSPDEITYHYLQVILVELEATRVFKTNQGYYSTKH